MVEPVEIYEYNPSWKEEFRRIGLRLRNALGDVARRIDHIGSTSIEGLAAKPVIDIQISVRRLEPMTLYLPRLEALGYVWRSDNPEKTKRYFREPPQERRTHIHVRKSGSWHEQFALLFETTSACTRMTSASMRRRSGRWLQGTGSSVTNMSTPKRIFFGMS